MINGRQPKQGARQDNQKQHPEQSPLDGLSPLETKAIHEIARKIKEAKSSELHGSLRLVIGFRGGVTQNVEFDKHESMR